MLTSIIIYLIKMKLAWLSMVLLFVSTLSSYDIANLPCPYGQVGRHSVFRLNDKEELVVTVYPEVAVIVDSRDGTVSREIKQRGFCPGV